MSFELNLTRQSKLVPAEQVNKTSVEAFGIGSLGGPVTLLLAKVGFKNIKVYDMDKVEEENIGPQVFSRRHLEMTKVEAMKEIIKDATGVDIEAKHGMVDEKCKITPEPNTVYMCFFDSFEARQIIFNKLKNYPVMYIDGRIGRFDKRHYLVDCSNKADVKSYERSLNTGAQSDLECGEKASAYINYQIASKIVGNYLNYLNGRKCNKIYVGNSLSPDQDIYVSMKEEKEEKEVKEEDGLGEM